MILHLIRHGKTVANEKRLYCGSTDVPLCKNGIAELEQLKAVIRYPSAELFVSTGLERTIQTTQILYNRNPSLIMAGFNEFNFGEFEMKSYEELKNNPAYINWIESYEEVCCPNGESKRVFVFRLKKAFDELKDIEIRSVVLICHGGVIATILEWLFPNQRNFYEWQPECGRGHTVMLNNKEAKYTAEI